jgi:uncharacterized Fe-S cluster-containing radical SAM superfamily protein
MSATGALSESFGITAAETGAPRLACPSCGCKFPFRVQGRTWQVRSPRDVADRLVARYGAAERESLLALSLNAKNAVRSVSEVYVGNVSASLVRVASSSATP